MRKFSVEDLERQVLRRLEGKGEKVSNQQPDIAERIKEIAELEKARRISRKEQEAPE